jgi:hypothetical protein
MAASVAEAGRFVAHTLHARRPAKLVIVDA